MSSVSALLNGEAMRSGDYGSVASVVIVSYNTRAMLARCLRSLIEGADGLRLEVFVVDNASRDGSAAMVSAEFPEVRLIESDVNLGFGAANNRALALATSPYIVLLNSDAFLQAGALRRAIEHLENEPAAGLGGARLIGQDGSWQPSARMFPSILNDFLALSGLASRFSASRFWGRGDRTWASPDETVDVDWVPGAFSIVRSDVLRAIGLFDESFFLYYEEVDLCHRIQAAGYAVRYWPDVVVVHVGGESSKTMPNAVRSRSGSQLTLWRMRSGLLYYRKHRPHSVRLAFAIEWAWHGLRACRNGLSSSAERQAKAVESRREMALLRQAWSETEGGRISPRRPW